MYVDIDTTRGAAEVHEATDLKRFSARASGPADPESLSQALGELGRAESSEFAWINISALRAASGRFDDPSWSAEFDAMIAYADSKGWVDDAGAFVRAHVEPLETSG